MAKNLSPFAEMENSLFPLALTQLIESLRKKTFGQALDFPRRIGNERKVQSAIGRRQSADSTRK